MKEVIIQDKSMIALSLEHYPENITDNKESKQRRHWCIRTL